MSNAIKSIRGAFKDLSETIPGLEVIEGAEYDLRISDPFMASWLQPLSYRSVNNVPNPPNPFDSQITLLEDERQATVPWLAPTREYATQYLKPWDDFVVAFADYGEVRTGSAASTHKRRSKRHTERRQESLSELGIEPERQLIITLDGRVQEAIAHRLAAYHLTTRGWFVSTDFTYLPSLGAGIPDIVAWKSPLTEALKEAGLVRNGVILEELAYLNVLDRNLNSEPTTRSTDTTTETLVAEVKGQKRSLGEAHTQLTKYLGWNAFDSGYCVVPGYRGRKKPGAGTLTFDAEGFDFIQDKENHYISNKKQQFVDNMDTAARQALLCGLPLSDLEDLATASGADGLETPHEAAMQLRNLSSETIIDAVTARLR